MRKVYAFDLGIYNPYKMSNAKISVNKAVKEGKPFFGEDYFNEDDQRLWEVRYDNSYPTVLYDPDLKKYRCYYSTFTTDRGSSRFSLEERKEVDYQPSTNRIVSLCYAESEDGVNWTKPNLGITNWKGSKENNIIGHYLHGTSILLDEQETNLDKKYKMFTKVDYGNGIHYMAVAFSKDGLDFGELIVLNDFNPRGDTYNSIIFDDYLNKYVLVTREWRDSMRVTCLATSSDFINWSEIEEIMHPRGFQNQIYSMPIFKDGDYQIGLASMFHEGDMSHEDYDTVDLELTYSYKYNRWNYADPGNPIIDRGKGNYGNGEFDCGCIYASRPIREGNRLYLYYIGGSGKHTNFREGSLSRAYIENDRYAYIEPKDKGKEAIVYTNAFVFLDEEVYMNADIDEKGSIDIELFHHDNTKIPNVTVSLKKVDHRYKINISGELDRTRAKMQITLKNAKCFGFEGNFEISRIENDTALLRI